jgi:hypothetical protein
LQAGAGGTTGGSVKIILGKGTNPDRTGHGQLRIRDGPSSATTWMHLQPATNVNTLTLDMLALFSGALSLGFQECFLRTATSCRFRIDGPAFVYVNMLADPAVPNEYAALYHDGNTVPATVGQILVVFNNHPTQTANMAFSTPSLNVAAGKIRMLVCVSAPPSTERWVFAV